MLLVGSRCADMLILVSRAERHVFCCSQLVESRGSAKKKRSQSKKLFAAQWAAAAAAAKEEEEDEEDEENVLCSRCVACGVSLC